MPQLRGVLGLLDAPIAVQRPAFATSLDCAHRDIAFLLCLDVELDGAAHRTPGGREHDDTRNELLQARGRYVLRLDSRSLGRDRYYRAREALAGLVHRHRRAIVLGRPDLPVLENILKV